MAYLTVDEARELGLQTSIEDSRPRCLRVPTDARSRCEAIQKLVRPSEVANLVHNVPSALLPPDYSFVEDVGRKLQAMFDSGSLRYIDDPPEWDRWCSPGQTLVQGGGDCDDFAILVASWVMKGGVPCDVVVGSHCGHPSCAGHAWVEGRDWKGWFLLEATVNVTLYRGRRPEEYRPQAFLRPGQCRFVVQARRLFALEMLNKRIFRRPVPLT